jgi:hypothetical protein
LVVRRGSEEVTGNIRGGGGLSREVYIIGWQGLAISKAQEGTEKQRVKEKAFWAWSTMVGRL